MWLQLLVILLSFITVARGEILDVTTIYDLSSEDNYGDVTGRVHVRTNALGLTIANGNLKRLDTYVQKLNLTCDLKQNRSCSWNYGSDWETKTYSLKELKPNKAYNVKNTHVNIGFQTEENYVYNEPIYFYFENNSTFSETKSVLVTFHNSYIGIYRNCDFDYIEHEYRFSITNGSETLEMYCVDFYSEFTLDPNNNYISFSFNGGNFYIYNGDELKRKFSGYAFDDEYHFTLYFVSANMFKPMLTVSGISAKTNGTEMISPLVMLEDTDKLCLALVIVCPEYSSRQDVLLLLAEDIHNTEHHLLTVNNVKAGVNVIHQCFNIMKILRPVRLILRSVMDISVLHISPYSPEGEEVWPLEPVAKSSLLRDYPTTEEWVYSNKINFMIPGLLYEEIGNITNPCQNGGVITLDGCACPPGFSGSECQIACGPNRFGLDCEGMCSLESEMCQNLLMCNSITGCHCPSGFKGTNCNENCNGGFYGNDCEQICGNCLSDKPCDKYTGECQSCEPGYVPPYCKEAYVYYASNPDISSIDYGTITVKFNPWDIAGVGTPELYQIQYRSKGEWAWSIYINKNIEKLEHSLEEEGNIEHFIEEKIEGLKTGHSYEVRVVLMDGNFNVYDGDLIKQSEIMTKCDVPEAYDYKMKTEATASSIVVSWSYTNETQYWCPIESFEVSWKQGWKWKKSSTLEEYFALGNLLPNVSIKFRVQAKTTGGYAPSSEITVSTKHQGFLSSEVRDLRVVAKHSSSAQISWNPPKDDDRPLLYKLTYKCVKQPACLPGCVNATEGALTQAKTGVVTLSPLLPFAQYQVTVNPEGGPKSTIYFGTEKLVPTEVPKPSEQTPLRSNTSLTVFWEPVPVCSGFLLGYNYQLLKELDNTKILDSGFTKATNVTFHHLKASTEYRARVYVVTIAGWNPDAFLEIKSSTSATVPDAVRNLTVYKKGRNMLGLRWAAPQSAYGLLKAFTISYSLGTEESSHIVGLTPCVPWPQLYCHTLQELKANRKYNISVSARNAEIAEDGEKSFVTAITRESPPMAPEGLKLINSSSTSISVEWRYPDLSNGIIRSYLISVEETEQFPQDNCCQIYPLIEIPVQEERLSYKSEVLGLHPASTYFVSVSAKTVGLGSSQSLVVHTKPPHLPFSTLPRLQAYSKAFWLPQEPQGLLSNQSEAYVSLIKAHLLLIVDQTGNGQSNDSGVFNAQLNALLHDLIAKPFFFYQEYNQDNLDVTLTTSSDVDSGWGACPSPSPFKVKDNYQLVAAQVSEYSNEFNVDLRYFSEAITFDV